MLELDDVQTFYGTSQVLFGMSMAVGAGEVVTLLGRNGMGKTTTVRVDHGPDAAARRHHQRSTGPPIHGLAVFRVAQAGPRAGAGGAADLPQPDACART